jgi:glycogen synthase
LPILYTKGQGIDGFFQEGIVGYHLDINNLNESLNIIKKLIDSYSKIQPNTISNSARFKWSIVANQYTKIYSSILKHGTLVFSVDLIESLFFI